MNHINPYLPLLVLLLAACTIEETQERRPFPDSDLIRVSASIAGASARVEAKAAVTKTSTTDGEKTNFTAGDKIGIYIVDYAGDIPEKLLPRENHANNICHSFDGTTWKMESPDRDQEQMYWPSPLTPIGICGYYPYNCLSVTPETDMMAIPFEIKTDQHLIADYSYNDLLCSVNGMKTTRNASDPMIAMEFVHALSKVQINIRFNDELKDLYGKSIVKSHLLMLPNLYGTAAIDLATPNTGTRPIAQPLFTEPRISVMPCGYTDPATDSQNVHYDASYKAILVPQKITSEMISIAIETTQGKSYTFTYQPPANTDGTPFALKSGFRYQFDMTIGKHELIVNTTNSINWETGADGGEEEIVMNNAVFNGLEWNRYNLGATSVNYEYRWDASVGNYYQWGRNTGFRKSITTADIVSGPIATGDIDNHATQFITNANADGNDWLAPPTDNDFWKGEQGPCPKGYRLPTVYELRGIMGNEKNDDKQLSDVQIHTDEILSPEAEGDASQKSTAHYIFDLTLGASGLPVKLYGLKKQGTDDAYLICWQRKNVMKNHLSYLRLEYMKTDKEATFVGKNLETIIATYFPTADAYKRAVLEFPCAEWIDKVTGTYPGQTELKTYGYYWSSTPGTTTPGTAWSIAFEARGPQVAERARANGYSVRCVSTRKIE